MTGNAGADAFVGRVDHLDELTRILGDVRRGRGGLVVVTGEAGIGKTRLCEETAERARGQGVQVAWAACWESASVAAAFDLLRSMPQARNLKLHDVARHVVDSAGTG